MSVPTQSHPIVTSTQCVPIPRDLTPARAKKDFTKMDKIALVIIFFFFLYGFPGNNFFNDVTNTYFSASKNSLLNPFTSSVSVPQTCIFLTDLGQIKRLQGLPLLRIFPSWGTDVPPFIDFNLGHCGQCRGFSSQRNWPVLFNVRLLIC